MLGQQTAGAVRFSRDERPDISGERTQLLDAFPAFQHGVQRGAGQRSLPSVVEVGLVLQGRAL